MMATDRFYTLAEDAKQGDRLTIRGDGLLWRQRDAAEPLAAIAMQDLSMGTVVRFPAQRYATFPNTRRGE